MMNVPQPASPPSALPVAAGYELRFQSLHNAGRAYTFPCNAAGLVDMDSLSRTTRDNYLYARTVVGCEFSVPAVVVRAAH